MGLDLANGRVDQALGASNTVIIDLYVRRWEFIFSFLQLIKGKNNNSDIRANNISWGTFYIFISFGYGISHLRTEKKKKFQNKARIKCFKNHNMKDDFQEVKYGLRWNAKVGA